MYCLSPHHIDGLKYGTVPRFLDPEMSIELGK